ncbi:MAG TPA: type II toxin-antitoxin system RelE/ParE family toxin [Steroidobacteraceae bacterium]|nr:type II toxin-antitoxin system RelE/ParE family toxin [Steroidobacteraceae bacterium]
MQVKELLLSGGVSPFGQWFERLDAVPAAKVATAIARLQQGNTSSVKWFEGIGEYRIDWGPGYRIYLARDGLQLILLLGGGTKKRQAKDIRLAIELWNVYRVSKRPARRT